MRDLKHLYEFEKLLQDANNELVQKAKNDERVLPINFSQDPTSFPEENVLKDW